jgi:hypothetical protein
MLKGSSIASCTMSSKLCVVFCVVILFSLSTLWFYYFWWFFGFLTCYYIWTRKAIFMELLAFCFNDPHKFSDYSFPSFNFLNMFSFLLKNIIILWVCKRHYVILAKVFDDRGSINPKCDLMKTWNFLIMCHVSFNQNFIIG